MVKRKKATKVKRGPAKRKKVTPTIVKKEINVSVNIDSAVRGLLNSHDNMITAHREMLRLFKDVGAVHLGNNVTVEGDLTLNPGVTTFSTMCELDVDGTWNEKSTHDKT